MTRNETKTLVILTPGFPKDEADTTCIPSRQIFVKALKEINPSLNIIVLAFQYPFVSKKYKWYGVDVISFNGRNKGKLHRAGNWMQVWRTLRKIKKENNVMGILNFWLGECALMGKYFAGRNSIKQFTWVLGQDAKKGNRYFSLTKPDGDNLIAVSDFISEEVFKNYGIRPLLVIPVGIDVSMFRKQQPERDIDVLAVGSLIRLKRYDLFVQVIKDIISYFPQIRAMICGKGEEEDRLKTLIHDLHLNDNISLPGELPHAEVIHLMQRAKVFLHTSSYEGFGTVCAEALYAGCHVISFCKPMTENIEHWHIVNSTDEMAKKAQEILTDQESKYDPVLFSPVEKIVTSIMELFRD